MEIGCRWEWTGPTGPDRARPGLDKDQTGLDKDQTGWKPVLLEGPLKYHSLTVTDLWCPVGI